MNKKKAGILMCTHLTATTVMGTTAVSSVRKSALVKILVITAR